MKISISMRPLIITLLASWAYAVQAQNWPYQQQVLHLHASDGRPLAVMMTSPRGGPNFASPAVIHCQGGPSATPLEGSGPWIAEGLAAQGYTVVQPEVRHAGELFNAEFPDFDKDVKATADYLEAVGFHNIVLTGSSFGSITATRYLVDTQDSRIKAVIHFSPTADMVRSVPVRLGHDAWMKEVETAGKLVSEDKSDEVVDFVFAHDAKVWLDFWGPASTGVNTLLAPQIHQPMLLLLGDQDGGIQTKETVQAMKDAATSSAKADFIYYEGGVNHSFYPIHEKVIKDTVNWLNGIGLGVKPSTSVEMVTTKEGKMGEDNRRALRYVPSGELKSGAPGVILVHDWTDDAFSGPSQWIGPALAQAGYTALGINAVRGPGELMRSKLTESDAALKSWIDYMEQQGFSHVVLAGHGFGATRISHYLATIGDARVIGMVYLAPTRDPGPWLREAVGDTIYQEKLDEARTLLKTADPTSPVPMRTNSRPAGEPIVQLYAHMDPWISPGMDTLKIAMVPEAFLANWGPEAPVLGAELKATRVPVLILVGTQDKGMSQASVQQLPRVRKGIDLKLYGPVRSGEPEVDHALAGSESRISNDVIAWMNALP
jgi:pimeloyl-ACP methyl ester carboxylesterase